jgi:hypothetical protein
MPVVYDHLRKLASSCQRSERPADTPRATALFHEAHMRPVGVDVTCEERVHFSAVAARILRRMLVDLAKSQNRQKRGENSPEFPWKMPS